VIIRERVGSVYREGRLGRADDLNDADGRKILRFSDVVRLGLDEERLAGARSSDLTVDQAIDEYLGVHSRGRSNYWKCSSER